MILVRSVVLFPPKNKPTPEGGDYDGDTVMVTLNKGLVAFATATDAAVSALDMRPALEAKGALQEEVRSHRKGIPHYHEYDTCIPKIPSFLDRYKLIHRNPTRTSNFDH